MAPSTGTCDSCGAVEVALETVRRVYVTPAAWDAEARADVQEDVEHWCFPCRTHYPHQELP